LIAEQVISFISSNAVYGDVGKQGVLEVILPGENHV
jgi:hypothetical protein